MISLARSPLLDKIVVQAHFIYLRLSHPTVEYKRIMVKIATSDNKLKIDCQIGSELENNRAALNANKGKY